MARVLVRPALGNVPMLLIVFGKAARAAASWGNFAAACLRRRRHDCHNRSI
jgi:hypothetical protein